MNTEDLKKIQEENFCLKLELDSLANVLLRNESERMVPNFSLGLIEHDHKERYNLITDYTKDKNVLDIACGTGYGTYHIATSGKAKSVIGGDIDPDAIRYAKHRYQHENISFQQENAEKISLDHTVDLVVSFETIEHLPNYKAFLESVDRVLGSDGIFIVSTPLSKLDINTNPTNRYHVQEWGFKYFQYIISDYFTIEKVYVQLFQDTFINEKVWEEYNIRRSKLSFFQKIKSRLKKNLLGIYDLPNYKYNWTGIQNYSKIEEYTNQYAASDLGDKYTGYQIIICRKR